MKKEARIFINKCKENICCGIILRFYSIDGFVISLNGCKDLCDRLKESGYFYELSYFNGDCNCGINNSTEVNQKYHLFLLSLIEEFENIYKNAGGGV
ncbi:hypothetical protein [Caldisphaera sp.]|uniref:hypothetical protein n=1 Tax=Caldisphaera sp. TaxID=2060322 RepID=UPI0025BE5895|nr:hypothetical protein [Caldisphaera sp.]